MVCRCCCCCWLWRRLCLRHEGRFQRLRWRWKQRAPASISDRNESVWRFETHSANEVLLVFSALTAFALHTRHADVAAADDVVEAFVQQPISVHHLVASETRLMSARQLSRVIQ